MLGIAAAAFLVMTLLVVHFSLKKTIIFTDRHEPLRPLDQDQRLLLPWAGHASNVFSLTALFGGYTAITVVLGLPAILGLALGSIIALFVMRAVIGRFNGKTFHLFLLSRRYSSAWSRHVFYLLLLTITQLLLAVSEIVILRELAIHAFNLPARHGTSFALSLALVGYYYCLMGRYEAVFKTDIIQLFFMILMCIVTAGYAVSDLFGAALDPNNVLLKPLRTDAWTFGIRYLSDLRHGLNFIVGLIAGSSLLLSSPDTWKRIFITSKYSRRSAFSFAGLVLAGAIPFALLMPALLVMPRPDYANPEIFAPLKAATDDKLLLITLTLGMMSSFLSTFDSALISATHLLLVRSEQKIDPRQFGLAGIDKYHIYLGGCLLAIVSGSLAFIFGTGNPYLPGVLVLGMYAILGGTILGTWGGQAMLGGRGGLPWLALLGLTFWFVYVVSFNGIIEKPIPEQLVLIPVSILIYILFFIFAVLEKCLAPKHIAAD